MLNVTNCIVIIDRALELAIVYEFLSFASDIDSNAIFNQISLMSRMIKRETAHVLLVCRHCYM